jgi:excisionase family DNA binding protein
MAIELNHIYMEYEYDRLMAQERREAKKTLPCAPVPKMAYTVKESAALSSVSERTIWTLIKSGELKSITVGNRRLIRHEDLTEFLKGGSR